VILGHVPAGMANLKPIGRVPASTQMELAIGLPLRSPEALTNLLEGIYDPASPQYHHYLSPGQFTETFGPTKEDYQALIAFAKASGFAVTGTHPNRLLLDVKASVADIERAFHVTLRSYRHPTEDRTFFAPDIEPSIDLAVPVLAISGLNNYRVPHPAGLRRKQTSPATSATPDLGTGPSNTYAGTDFRAAYVPGTTLTGSGQAVGLVEFSNYAKNDIRRYENLTGLPNVTVDNVVLDNLSQFPLGNDNDEVALDIDMAISMAPSQSEVIVYEGVYPDDILNRMATDNLAEQLSASWTYPIDATSEQIFQQFAAQGQSFFNASGDDGAYAGAVDQPADDPYITVVGGTTLTTSNTIVGMVTNVFYQSEAAWNWNMTTAHDTNSTGGGISTTYAIPSWQQGINMSANQGSTAMRNLPDVAMIADNIYLFFNNGSNEVVGGTSCASPLWAAFTALVNQQAATNGHPSIGFINPAVYAVGKGPNYASCFHDITTGNNTNKFSPTHYYAVAGYDLCTGWGTPNGTNMINALIAQLPQNNRWTSSAAGKWETSANWSSGTPASNQSVFVTNAVTKTVTIDATTSGSFPGSLTVQALYLTAPSGTINTLALTNAGAATPLLVLDTLFVGTNAALTVKGSSLAAGSLVAEGPVQVNGGTLTILGEASFDLDGPITVTNGGAVVFAGPISSTIQTQIFYGGGATGGALISSNAGVGSVVFLAYPIFSTNNGTLMVTGGNDLNYGQIGGDLVNNYLITGNGTLTGNYSSNNFAILNQGTIASSPNGLLVLDPRDAFDFGGVQNTPAGTIVVASGSTLAIRRTANAWYNSNSYPTNSGTVLMQGGTLMGEDTNAVPGLASAYVNGSTGLIHGCGTFENFATVVNNGSILADCGGTLTFSGIVTNNGTMQALDGTVLEWYGPVVNNGTINALGGSVEFHSTFINNGVFLASNPVPVITSVHLAGLNVQISFTTTNGAPYTVQFNNDLVAGAWMTLTNMTGNGNIMTATDFGGATQTQRFYRVGIIN
jgi:hypothetical protein